MKRIRIFLIFTAALLSFPYVSAVEIPAAGWSVSGNASPSGNGTAEWNDPSLDPKNDPDADLVNSPGGRTALYDAAMAAPANSDGPAYTEIEAVQVVAGGSKGLILTALSGAEESLREKMTGMEYANALVKLETGSLKLFPIEYDFSALDSAGAGMGTLRGTVKPPEGYSISPKIADVTVPIFLCDQNNPQEIPIISCQLTDGSPVLLTQNESAEDLLDSRRLEEEVWPSLDNDIFFCCGLDWDLSGIQFGTPGIYVALGRLRLPEGATATEGTKVSCIVQIQENDSFTLGPPAFKNLHFVVSWRMDTPDISLFRRYYAVAGGDWQEDTDGKFIRINQENTQYMYVFYYEDMLFDTPYYFRLSYDGQFSNTLEVYVSEGQLNYRFYEGDRDGGDRDEQNKPDLSQPAQTKPEPDGDEQGEDEQNEAKPGNHEQDEAKPGNHEQDEAKPGNHEQNEAKPGNHEQNEAKPGNHDIAGNMNGDGGGNRTGKGGREDSAPAASGQPPGIPGTPASEITSGPAVEADAASPSAGGILAKTNSDIRMEADTATYVILSGRRIAALLEGTPGFPLTFEKQRIRLEIPADSGLLANMAQESLLRADIVPKGAASVLIRLSVDGIPVSPVPPLTVTIPWHPADADAQLEVLNRYGDVAGTASYIGDSVVFTVHDTGLFTVVEKTADTAAVGTDSAEKGADVGRAKITAGTAQNFRTNSMPGNSDSPVSLKDPSCRRSLMSAGILLSFSGLMAGRAFSRRRGKKHNSI